MPKDMRPSLAKRIRFLRQKHGMTQEQLCNASGVTLKYIQNLEGKKPYNPTLNTMQKLAEGFGIPLWKLLQFDE